MQKIGAGSARTRSRSPPRARRARSLAGSSSGEDYIQEIGEDGVNVSRIIGHGRVIVVRGPSSMTKETGGRIVFNGPTVINMHQNRRAGAAGAARATTPDGADEPGAGDNVCAICQDRARKLAPASR